jgi:hypothetical protein
MKLKVVLSAALLLFGMGLAHAEERFGVKVYDGAVHDTATSKFLKEAMSLDAFCYRTSAGTAKVVEFYQKQTELKLIGAATKEGALFKRCTEEYNEYLKENVSTGCDLEVTVQSPWMDMKTGTMNSDTLISIVKQE